jgi:hypothetical protein
MQDEPENQPETPELSLVEVKNVTSIDDGLSLDGAVRSLFTELLKLCYLLATSYSTNRLFAIGDYCKSMDMFRSAALEKSYRLRPSSSSVSKANSDLEDVMFRLRMIAPQVLRQLSYPLPSYAFSMQVESQRILWVRLINVLTWLDGAREVMTKHYDNVALVGSQAQIRELTHAVGTAGEIMFAPLKYVLRAVIEGCPDMIDLFDGDIADLLQYDQILVDPYFGLALSSPDVDYDDASLEVFRSLTESDEKIIAVSMITHLVRSKARGSADAHTFLGCISDAQRQLALRNMTRSGDTSL